MPFLAAHANQGSQRLRWFSIISVITDKSSCLLSPMVELTDGGIIAIGQQSEHVLVIDFQPVQTGNFFK